MSLPTSKIKLIRRPLHQIGSPTVLRNKDDIAIFEDWLQTLLNSGKLVTTTSNDSLVLSPHIVVLSGNKKRVVGNYKVLKDITRKFSFLGPKIPNIQLQSAKYLYRSKIDLKLGFNNVLAESESQSLLAFESKGQFFKFTVVPLGISNGPVTFDSWSSTFVQKVHPLIPSDLQYHQDDFVVSDNDQQRCFASTLVVAYFLMAVKSQLNWEKSLLKPSYRANIIGADVSFDYIPLAPKKRQRIQQHFSVFVQKEFA